MLDEKEVNDMLDDLVGGTPVSVQLSAALERMAKKEHTHDDYVSREEFDELKKKVEMLIDLVGDMSVSEQINAALSQIK